MALNLPGSDIKVMFSNTDCIYCGKGKVSKEEEEEELSNLGKLHDKNDYFAAHYLCILTATGLPQSAKLNQEFFGFTYQSIADTFWKNTGKRCMFCYNICPSIACNSCSRKFHLPCGIEHFCVVEMFGSYKAYCNACYVSLYPQHFSQEMLEGDCFLCYETLSESSDGLEDSTNSRNGFRELLYQPRCCKSAQMCHLKCVKKLAYNAGRNTKCPLCCNKRIFRNSVRKMGVYIPDAESKWLGNGTELLEGNSSST